MKNLDNHLTYSSKIDKLSPNKTLVDGILEGVGWGILAPIILMTGIQYVNISIENDYTQKVCGRLEEREIRKLNELSNILYMPVELANMTYEAFNCN